MAKIPTFTRLNMGDSPEAPDWVPNMYNIINQFAEDVNNGFSGNLTIGANVQGAKFVASVLTRADYATGGFDVIRLNYTGKGIPNSLLLGQISRADGTPIITTIGPPQWFLNINVAPAQVTITYIPGLVASTRYNLVLLAL